MHKDIISLLRIANIFFKARIDLLIKEYSSSNWNLVFFFSPWQFFSSSLPRGERLVVALEEAGPIFIKFGQLLSTRPDIIPADIAKSLSRLQDNLKPFSSDEAKKIITNELNKPIQEIFSSFEDKPIAAASIAQVHKAKLRKSNEEVVVKVVRPGIEKIIFRDISLMKRIARFIENRFSEAKRLRLLDLVMEYETVINSELDMRIESSNMKQTKIHFEENDLLHVPKVYLELTTKKVLTMERISGIPIDNISMLEKKGVNLQLLAERGVEIFLKQVFIDNFFHADMHPGNIFVNIEDPSNPSYVAVDYAIVGTLKEEEQFQIGRMLMSVVQRNFKEIATIMIDVKWVNPSSNPIELERTIRVACEPVFEQPMEKIKFGELLLDIFESARSFDLNMQPSLMLLQKTLINIEGLGKQLFPKLDFWSIADPFLQNWITERYDPSKITEWAQSNAIHWIEKARKLPETAESALNQLNKLEQYNRDSEDRHTELMAKVLREQRTVYLALVTIMIGLGVSFWFFR